MPLDRDQILAIQRRTEIPDPTGKPAGWTLTITGGDDAFDWRNPPEAETLTWHGNPDGLLTAVKASLCRDIDTPALYQNQDGGTIWALVGSGGSGFPVGPEDDGTYTASVEYGTADGSPDPSHLNILAFQDGFISTVFSVISLFPDGAGGLGVNIRTTTGDVQLQSDHDEIVINGDQGVTFVNAVVYMGALPTSDPASSGQLYVDGSGFVKMSL